jgi:hypothetical protein
MEIRAAFYKQQPRYRGLFREDARNQSPAAGFGEA